MLHVHLNIQYSFIITWMRQRVTIYIHLKYITNSRTVLTKNGNLRACGLIFIDELNHFLIMHLYCLFSLEAYESDKSPSLLERPKHYSLFESLIINHVFSIIRIHSLKNMRISPGIRQ